MKAHMQEEDVDFKIQHPNPLPGHKALFQAPNRCISIQKNTSHLKHCSLVTSQTDIKDKRCKKLKSGSVGVWQKTKSIKLCNQPKRRYDIPGRSIGNHICENDALHSSYKKVVESRVVKNKESIEPILKKRTKDLFTEVDQKKGKMAQLLKSSTLVHLCNKPFNIDNGEESRYQCRLDPIDDPKQLKKLYNTWKDRYVNLNCDRAGIHQRAKSLPSDLQSHVSRNESVFNIFIDRKVDLLFDLNNYDFGCQIKGDRKGYLGHPLPSKELLIIEPTHSDKDTVSFDIDNILAGQQNYDKNRSRLALAFSDHTNSLEDAKLIVESRDDSPNKKKLKHILKSNKVQTKSDYYEIELNGNHQRAGNTMSYVLAVGMTVGAVGVYVASQTVKKGLGLLKYMN